MNFIIGCNYWASNAGAEMWRNWSEEAVRNDLKILSSHGIEYLRVFPNWRDFQPVTPVYGGGAYVREYLLEGDRKPENPYWLDEVMLGRFSVFCDICEEYGIKLIVGLITGWMSGRLFIPPAMFGKNLFTDPCALLFEQRFVRGFVERFKDRKAVWAWDLGNECNCMCQAEDKYVASNWTGTIASAIRAADPSRPIVSGMHSLSADDDGAVWTIGGQAEFCDILTTHPYPFWVEHAYKDRNASFRTAMHATCETKLYSDLGGRRCLVEEIGTMGPMLCSDEQAADFMRVNLFSNWANGALGVMWWCAHEQLELNTPPYTQMMCEVELGMTDRNLKPKPVLEETKKIASILRGLDFTLPKADTDAVCILTQSQKQWAAAYMTYCLSKQAGLNISFSWCVDELPESDLYIMPSVCGFTVMPKNRYLELKKRVKDGASLYISNDTGIFSEFEELCGVRVKDSGAYHDRRTIFQGGEELVFSRNRRYEIDSVGAQVLCCDSEGLPAVTMNSYGKGKVFYVNFPLETMLISEDDAFDGGYYKIYRSLFKDVLNDRPVRAENKYTPVTIHEGEDGIYCVVINYSPEAQETTLVIKPGFEIERTIFGDCKKLPAFAAAVFKAKKS